MALLSVHARRLLVFAGRAVHLLPEGAVELRGVVVPHAFADRIELLVRLADQAAGLLDAHAAQIVAVGNAAGLGKERADVIGVEGEVRRGGPPADWEQVAWTAFLVK